jgi:hypothetical protein
MSVTIDSTTDDMTRAAYPLPTGDATVCLLFKPTTNYVDGIDHILFELSDGTGANTFALNKYLDNNWYSGWIVGGVDERIVVTSGSYTVNANAWNSLIYDYSPTGALANMRLNGTLIGTRSAALSTLDLSAQTLHIGNSRAGSEDARANFAHVGVWARVLSAADRALYISGGVPSGYLSYWPSARDLKDSAAAARDLTGVNIAMAGGDPNYTVSRNATRGATRGVLRGVV